MIIAKRNGKTYECNEEDLARIRELCIHNSGDLNKAIRQQFEEKYKEPYGMRDPQGVFEAGATAPSPSQTASSEALP